MVIIISSLLSFASAGYFFAPAFLDPCKPFDTNIIAQFSIPQLFPFPDSASVAPPWLIRDFKHSAGVLILCGEDHTDVIRLQFLAIEGEPLRRPIQSCALPEPCWPHALDQIPVELLVLKQSPTPILLQIFQSLWMPACE